MSQNSVFFFPDSDARVERLDLLVLAPGEAEAGAIFRNFYDPPADYALPAPWTLQGVSVDPHQPAGACGWFDREVSPLNSNVGQGNVLHFLAHENDDGENLDLFVLACSASEAQRLWRQFYELSEDSTPMGTWRFPYIRAASEHPARALKWDHSSNRTIG